MNGYQLHLVTNNASNTLIVSRDGCLVGIVRDSDTQNGARQLRDQLRANNFGANAGVAYESLEEWCDDLALTGEDQALLLEQPGSPQAFDERDPSWLPIAISAFGEETE